MSPTAPLTAREPAIVIGTVTTAVTAVLALLVAFGIDLSQGQQVAILGVIAGVGPLVVAFLTRSKVAPIATVVAQQVDGQVIAGPASVLDTGAPVEVLPLAPVGERGPETFTPPATVVVPVDPTPPPAPPAG